MVHLENVFLKNVLLYLPTLKDVGRFAQVCKSCEEAINTIYVNPYELTIHHSFDEIIPLFPNLQTFYVRRCPERLYKISANDIPLIEIGGWNETAKQTKMFDTKWFCSKIRKLRMEGYYCKKVIEKHPEYFTQLQELVILNSNDLNLIRKMIELPTLKKVIILCSISEFQELSKMVDFNKYKQINFIIILNEYGFIFSQCFDQIDYNQFVNCRFYTRVLNKSTINLPYLPSLPYEQKFLMGFDKSGASVVIKTDVLDKINQINEIIVKNDIRHVVIENILNNFEGNRIDLTTLPIELLSIKKVEKQNLVFVIPPGLKSLTIYECKASIDISKCYLKELTLREYQGKPIDVHDDNLKVFETDFNQEIKWYHNDTLLNQNEIYLDANKITLFKTGCSHIFINGERVEDNSPLKTIIFKYNDKEIRINEVSEFSFENKFLYCSLGNVQELDFGEYPFCGFVVTNSKISHLKIKSNSVGLTHVECDDLIIDGACTQFGFTDCKIDTLTCDTIECLSCQRSDITTINANEIKKINGPSAKSKIRNAMKEKGKRKK
ncbi:hypothetical protein EDI_325580 [Entamoeba dispar SAW760]|uniref:F-box domain-containing protein n=1 Tax=Entamoeba dispar (strain ATCC PRA-260 / SAW760) TaxID=370354 RepID=B0EBR9_ENTDS|nr:uncharacterized protein EDI_325580 [Entamoeba dispar SAW760]EDR28081.1 hypothetical protein EDI_325580 [Entamoeba dispar SAW760]|eukprot:EDR28081.1 hypothetical protein EDI_325580 [Entamoeba dispar SAW760]